MVFDSFMNRQSIELAMSTGDWMKERRERMALEELERLAHKKQELREQTSESNTPAERIRIWERRHALALPRDPNHTVIAVVATATGLSVEQVQQEQLRRKTNITAQSLSSSP